MIIEFENARVVVEDDVVDSDRTGIPTDPSRLRPGESYMAWSAAQGKWILLTCSSLNVDRKYVIPIEQAYCYDSWVCHRVMEIQ